MIEEPLSPCHTGIFASNHVKMTTSHRNQPVHLPHFATWFFYLLAWFVGGMCFTAFSETQLTPSENLKTATSQDSTSFYLSSQVQVIHLQIHDSDLEKMKSALPKRIYVPATFRWGNQTIENVGVRYKGNSSSRPNQRHKRSFLIKFNEFDKESTFLGLQRVALDNGVQFGSLFSEQLVTGILRNLNIKSSRCNFAKLYLNDKYHGVYTNVERIDSVFLQNEFVGGGALYKVDVYNEQGKAGANLRWVKQLPHPDVRLGAVFEPKSSAAHTDAHDVLELISKINQTPDNDFARVMEKTIDMEAFLKTMAVMLFSGAFDQLTGWNPHNYYLYHEPQSQRWHYLPWDLDVGFADNAFRYIPVVSGWNAAWPVMGSSPSPLVERIVDNSQLLARYRRLADSILEEYFHPKVLLPRVDSLYKRIKDDLTGDPFPHRRATNPEDQSYESIIDSIKDFIRRRYDTARAQLDNPGTRPQIVKHTPRRDHGPQPGKPSADDPTGLHVTSSSSSFVTLKWTDNSKNEGAYIVQRADGGEGQEFRNHIGQPGADIITASDISVVPGWTYRYRVYALRPTPAGPQGTGVSNTITVHVPNRGN